MPWQTDSWLLFGILHLIIDSAYFYRTTEVIVLVKKTFVVAVLTIEDERSNLQELPNNPLP